MPPLLKITNFYKFNFSHFLHWMIFFPKVSLLVKCPTAFDKDGDVWSKLLWITGRWHSCHFLSGQKASATNLPDVSFYRIRPLTSSNPGFWGQCQVPGDFDKCLTSEEGGGCLPYPKLLRPMSAKQPPDQNQHANPCKALSRRKSDNFPNQSFGNFSSLEEFEMHPAEVHIFFFRSVTNLGHRSIFFRCNRITGHDGPKIWAVTKEVKSGSRLKMSSVWPKSFLGWTRTSVHRSRREQWTPCFSFFLMILQL